MTPERFLEHLHEILSTLPQPKPWSGSYKATRTVEKELIDTFTLFSEKSAEKDFTQQAIALLKEFNEGLKKLQARPSFSEAFDRLYALEERIVLLLEILEGPIGKSPSLTWQAPWYPTSLDIESPYRSFIGELDTNRLKQVINESIKYPNCRDTSSFSF